MKIKGSRILAVVMVLALACAVCGCKNETTTPTPAPTTAVTPAATIPAASAAMPASSASPAANGSMEPEGAITGFEEGKTVAESELDSAVKDAVKAKYPDATIKSVTYETYMNQQCYHVMLSGSGSATEEVYVTGTGTVLPFSAASASPAGSPSGSPKS